LDLKITTIFTVNKPICDMRFLILLLLVSLFFSNHSFADIDSEENTQRGQTNSKISQILLKWQTSDNPEEFAKANGLLYKDGTIQVYIHVSSEEFLSQISPEINVIASDQKIAAAYVTSEQLDMLENLEYVERVTLPDLAKTPPIPQIVNSDKPQNKEQDDYTQIGIILAVIVAIAIIAIVLQRKRTKST